MRIRRLAAFGAGLAFACLGIWSATLDARQAPAGQAPAAPAPQKTAKAQTKRRRKAIMALRALHRKIGD